MEQESDINEKDWQKVERTARKNGLRDGISEGREMNFQTNFNEGFALGFKGGYMMGKLKGSLAALSAQTNSVAQDNPILNKLETGWCQICNDSNLQNESISDVTRQQMETVIKNLEVLQSICPKDIESI